MRQGKPSQRPSHQQLATGSRQGLCGKFGPKYASAVTANAMADLKMKFTESSTSFFYHVILAVDKVVEASVMSHFKAGSRDDINQIVLGAAIPPDKVDDMLKLA